MGKSKNRKVKRRNQPIGIPTEKELMEEEEELPDADDVAKAVDLALEKVKSFSSEERECGAAIIARKTDDERFVSYLMESSGVKVIAPLLVDHSLAVRHVVCGCLRNLSMNSKIAEEMVQQDVMTPLCCLFKNYSSKWAPSAKSEGKIDSKKEIFIEACNLLSCLCESSTLAVDIFNKSNLIAALLPCLNVQHFSLDVTLAVVECLHTVTENNPDAIAKTSQTEINMLRSLISITPTEIAHVQLRTLAVGVVLNLCQGRIDIFEPTGCSILKVLEHTLDITVQPDVEKIAEEINCQKEKRKDRSADPDEIQNHLLGIIAKLKLLERVLVAKQTALEILANICSADDTDIDEDASSTSSEDYADLEDVSEPVDFFKSIPCEVRGFIVNEKILQKILQQIVIPSEKISQLFKDVSNGAVVLKRLYTVRCRALICISNIVQELSTEELGGVSELFQLWKDLSVLVFSQTVPSDVEQLEAATASIRAILQKLAESNSAEHFGKLTANDLQLFFDMWQKCTDSGAKVNILHAVGTIGCILASLKQPNASALIKSVGTFLTEACTRSAELWVVSEALDAIFDVFSEDHLDCIAQEIGLVNKLKQVLPMFKGKSKSLRDSSEHLPIIKTSKTNLIRFLRYKEKYHKKVCSEVEMSCI